MPAVSDEIGVRPALLTVDPGECVLEGVRVGKDGVDLRARGEGDATLSVMSGANDTALVQRVLGTGPGV